MIYYKQIDDGRQPVAMVVVPAMMRSVVIENLVENGQYVFEVAAREFEDGREVIGDKGTSEVVKVVLVETPSNTGTTTGTFNK